MTCWLSTVIKHSRARQRLRRSVSLVLLTFAALSVCCCCCCCCWVWLMAFCRRHRTSQHHSANKNMSGPDDQHDMHGALAWLLVREIKAAVTCKSKESCLQNCLWLWCRIRDTRTALWLLLLLWFFYYCYYHDSTLGDVKLYYLTHSVTHCHLVLTWVMNRHVDLLISLP